MHPFRIDVSDAELLDLRERLLRTRLLPDSPHRPASGMTSAYLRSLIESWLDFDWRAREAWLNAHPQFLADVDDTTIHFAHLKSARPDAPALLVMHGWPHLFSLQLDFADLLPDFDVIVASLPGFAFSPPYREGMITESRLATTMHRLMTEVLGYDRYLTYGEDVSANVSDLIAATYPAAVTGILVTHAHFPTGQERRGLRLARGTGFLRAAVSAARDRRRVRPRPGHAPRHAGGRSQRFTRGAAGLAGREAGRVERYAFR